MQRGFTLIEMAIVLAIVSAMAVGALNAVGAQRTNAALKRTADRAEAIDEALRLFVARERRLPCPALIAPGSEDNRMREDCDGAGDVRHGLVPAVTLGIAPSQALDAWGHQFFYAVAGAATATDSLEAGKWPDLIELKRAAEDPTTLRGVVAFFSAGPNGSGAFDPTGNERAEPLATSLDEWENLNPDAVLVDAPYSGSDTRPFDDIVRVLTEDQIIGRLAAAGLATPKAALTMQRMATAAQAIVGQTIQSGSNALPATLPPGLPAVDGWGGGLIYAPLVTNVWSTTTEPAAFTLTSYGPDGSVGVDDMSLTYTVPRMLGLLAQAGVIVEVEPDPVTPP